MKAFPSKREILAFGLAFVATITISTVGLSKAMDWYQQQKQITVSLPLPAWQQIVDIVDNAPISGEVRKPLINAMVTQINKQLPQDSTTTKPKGK